MFILTNAKCFFSKQKCDCMLNIQVRWSFFILAQQSDDSDWYILLLWYIHICFTIDFNLACLCYVCTPALKNEHKTNHVSCVYGGRFGPHKQKVKVRKYSKMLHFRKSYRPTKAKILLLGKITADKINYGQKFNFLLLSQKQMKQHLCPRCCHQVAPPISCCIST